MIGGLDGMDFLVTGVSPGFFRLICFLIKERTLSKLIIYKRLSDYINGKDFGCKFHLIKNHYLCHLTGECSY
jgi:hypothetical protein